MSLRNSILEGLSTSRNISESYEDVPTSGKSRELQKIASDVLNKKYKPLFKNFPIESVGVEVYVHDDDDIMVDDVIYEITVYIAFDINAELDIKAIKSIIGKNMRNYPKFIFDKPSNQFYATADEYDDIIDVIDTLERDGCKIRQYYSIQDASEIENRVDRQMREWKAERDYQEWEYNRSRM